MMGERRVETAGRGVGGVTGGVGGRRHFTLTGLFSSITPGRAPGTMFAGLPRREVFVTGGVRGSVFKIRLGRWAVSITSER